MEIDIRKEGTEAVDRIRFDEPHLEDDGYFADSLWFYSGDCNVWIKLLRT